MRCSEGLRGWDYLCTYDRDGERTKTGFLVDDWGVIRATSDEVGGAGDVGPAPGHNVPWGR